MNKYLQFSNTISGTTYFLRNLLSYFTSFILGYGIGFNIAKENWFFVAGFSLLLIPVLVFSLATLWKRLKAIFPEEASPILVTFLIVSIISEVISGTVPGNIVRLGIFIFNLVLIFKHSGIFEHKG